LKNANFNLARIHEVKFNHTHIEKAQNLNQAAYYQVDFHNAYLKDLDWTGRDLTLANFRNTNLKNINFAQTNLSKTDFTQARLENINLTSANIKDADFNQTTRLNINAVNTNLDGAVINFPALNPFYKSWNLFGSAYFDQLIAGCMRPKINLPAGIKKTIFAGPSDDYLYGTVESIIWAGSGADDIGIYFPDNSDHISTVIPGPGDDVITGGDHLVYQKGDGLDTIERNRRPNDIRSEHDIIIMENITQEEVNITRNEYGNINGVYLKDGSGGIKIVGGSMEKVIFNQGTLYGTDSKDIHPDFPTPPENQTQGRAHNICVRFVEADDSSSLIRDMEEQAMRVEAQSYSNNSDQDAGPGPGNNPEGSTNDNLINQGGYPDFDQVNTYDPGDPDVDAQESGRDDSNYDGESASWNSWNWAPPQPMNLEEITNEQGWLQNGDNEQQENADNANTGNYPGPGPGPEESEQEELNINEFVSDSLLYIESLEEWYEILKDLENNSSNKFKNTINFLKKDYPRFLMDLISIYSEIDNPGPELIGNGRGPLFTSIDSEELQGIYTDLKSQTGYTLLFDKINTVFDQGNQNPDLLYYYSAELKVNYPNTWQMFIDKYPDVESNIFSDFYFPYIDSTYYRFDDFSSARLINKLINNLVYLAKNHPNRYNFIRYKNPDLDLKRLFENEFLIYSGGYPDFDEENAYFEDFGFAVDLNQEGDGENVYFEDSGFAVDLNQEGMDLSFYGNSYSDFNSLPGEVNFELMNIIEPQIEYLLGEEITFFLLYSKSRDPNATSDEEHISGYYVTYSSEVIGTDPSQASEPNEWVNTAYEADYKSTREAFFEIGASIPNIDYSLNNQEQLYNHIKEEIKKEYPEIQQRYDFLVENFNYDNLDGFLQSYDLVICPSNSNNNLFLTLGKLEKIELSGSNSGEEYTLFHYNVEDNDQYSKVVYWYKDTADEEGTVLENIDFYPRQ
ncbi:MAG: hypothetical protein GF332_02610, partial [Candidatus Moranbacteria bacterium]|nr:hypothetical protein [Candidatus Moranbacteria bacterium]